MWDGYCSEIVLFTGDRCKNKATWIYEGAPVCAMHDPNVVWYSSPKWQKERARDLGYKVPGHGEGRLIIVEKES